MLHLGVRKEEEEGKPANTSQKSHRRSGDDDDDGEGTCGWLIARMCGGNGERETSNTAAKPPVVYLYGFRGQGQQRREARPMEIGSYYERRHKSGGIIGHMHVKTNNEQ